MAENKKNSRGTRSGYTGKTTRSKKAQEREAQRLREEALRKSMQRRRIASVILFAVGVFFTLLAIIPGSEGWRALYNVMHGLFGFSAYLAGPALIYIAVITSAKVPKTAIAWAVFRSVFFLLLICAAVEIFAVGKVNGGNFGEVVKNLYINGKDFKGGGFFAIILGVPLLFLGKLGAAVIIIILALAGILFMINMPLNEMFSKMGGAVKNAGATAKEYHDRRREESAAANEEYQRLREEKRRQKAIAEREKFERRKAEEAEKRQQLLDVQDIKNSVGKPMSEKQAPEPQKPVEPPEMQKQELSEPVPEQPAKKPEIKLLGEEKPDIIREQNEETRDYQQALRKYMEKRHPIMRDDKPDPAKYEDNDIELVPIIDALDKLNAEKGPARVSKIVDAPKKDLMFSDEKEEKTEEVSDISDVEEAELPIDLDDIISENRPSDSVSLPEPLISKPEPKKEITSSSQGDLLTLEDVYTLPPMSLLNPVKKPVLQSDIDSEIRRNADKLVETLKSFGVMTTYLGASRGPSVTRYELQPAPGVKISKIANLADDVALSLAVSDVRIAPVPDKAAVGIEIPNKVKDTVFFRELVDSAEFKKTFDKKLDTVLGKDISGNTVSCNVSKMPHLLIAGTTGSGKSVCVNSIIMSILMKSTPSDVRLIMVDPKQVEFMMYNGIPHLLIPVVTDPKKAAGALAWAVTEMERRYTLFSENNVRNIDGFNELCEHDEELVKMPSIVIFIDELADLMMASPKDVEDSIVRLAQKARAAGMHLVIATQKPTVQVVTGLIKGNIPSRIALMVASQIDSRVILDASGAEKLLGNGDMLYMPVGAPKPIRLQGCYVSDDEVERVAEFITQTFKAEYDEGIMAEIDRQAEIVSSGDKNASAEDDSSDGEQDDKLDEAIEFVVTAGQASTSSLQRHLKLGYGRAARLIDTMEKMGVVGPYEGSKPRQVLMTKQEWYEKRLRN